MSNNWGFLGKTEAGLGGFEAEGGIAVGRRDEVDDGRT